MAILHSILINMPLLFLWFSSSLMTQKCGTHKVLHRVKKTDDKYCSLWELPVFLSYIAITADEHL